MQNGKSLKELLEKRASDPLLLEYARRLEIAHKFIDDINHPEHCSKYQACGRGCCTPEFRPENKCDCGMEATLAAITAPFEGN